MGDFGIILEYFKRLLVLYHFGLFMQKFEFGDAYHLFGKCTILLSFSFIFRNHQIEAIFACVNETLSFGFVLRLSVKYAILGSFCSIYIEISNFELILHVLPPLEIWSSLGAFEGSKTKCSNAKTKCWEDGFVPNPY